ncbi:MAG: hypothetical protein AABY18_08610 [Candidatus Thermoplasmatota archaeon]
MAFLRALGLALVTTGLVLALVPAPAGANHMQMDSGRVIVFDHAGGNQWWVEAQLAGQDGGQVASLWVASYPASSSMWTPMTWHADWGKWTASSHVPPGDPVKFRAMWDGGAMQSSCWFSHPAGEEACGGSGNPTPFDATFTLVTGNEWWVQTQVTPNNGHSVDHVEVLVGSEWKSLRLQSWGVREYGASYHFPQGSVVQFRASDTQSLSDLSSCYGWIPPQGNGQTAGEVSCSSPPPPPGFTATWSQVAGNNWWVEGVLTASEPVYSVFLTIDCSTGDPADMSYNAAWGKWTLGNTHIPTGAKVTFTANGGSSGTQVHSGGYIWPNATPTSGC